MIRHPRNMNTNEIMDTLRRWKNRVRIWILERFTGRVKRIQITDRDGKKHDVVVEKQLQKVCDHKRIREIAPTMWKCETPDCPVYFQIGYKVMLDENDLMKYLQDITDHLKLGLTDHA